MTEAEGRGVQAWARLANAALSKMNRDEAKALVVDLLEPRELAEMMAASSAAGVAVDGQEGGNLLYEAAADHIVNLQRDAEIAGARQ